MEFRHLHSFIAVAEELSFTKAAHRLHIAQPPVSRHISELEKETGVHLFVRDRRSVKLTEAGRVLLGEARILVSDAERFWSSVRRVKDGESDVVRVRVGFGLRMAAGLAGVLAEHVKKYRSLDIQCEEIPSGHQSKALLEQRIDVAFMRTPPTSALLVSEHVYEEGLVVLLSKSNPLSEHKTLRLKQLAGQRLLLHNRSLSAVVYDKITTMYRSAGLVPQITHVRAWPGEAASIIVASGKGIFIVPGATGYHWELEGKVAAIPLNEPLARIEVYMSWRAEENSPAIVTMINAVRRAFRGGRQAAFPLKNGKKALARAAQNL